MYSHSYPAHLWTRLFKPSSSLPRNSVTHTHTRIYHSPRHLHPLSVLVSDQRPLPDHLLSAPLFWVLAVRLSHLALVHQHQRSPVTAACGRNTLCPASHLTSTNLRPRVYHISPTFPYSPHPLRPDQRLRLPPMDLSGTSSTLPRLSHSSRPLPDTFCLSHPSLKHRSSQLFSHVSWMNGRPGWIMLARLSISREACSVEKQCVVGSGRWTSLQRPKTMDWRRSGRFEIGGWRRSVGWSGGSTIA